MVQPSNKKPTPNPQPEVQQTPYEAGIDPTKIDEQWLGEVVFHRWSVDLVDDLFQLWILGALEGHGVPERITLEVQIGYIFLKCFFS